jgi:hypothetical protein
MLSTYFSPQTTSCKMVMGGGLMPLFCTTLMIVVDKVNGDSIWKEGFQMRRTTTCACRLIPKILIPFQVKNDVLFYFAIIEALRVVYCIGGILFEKKIGSGNGPNMRCGIKLWTKRRVSGSIQNPKPWHPRSQEFNICPWESGSQGQWFQELPPPRELPSIKHAC